MAEARQGDVVLTCVEAVKNRKKKQFESNLTFDRIPEFDD